MKIDTYDRACKMMKRLDKNGKCTSAAVKKIIHDLRSKEEREEYVGVKLYYLEKRYHALVRQGK